MQRPQHAERHLVVGDEDRAHAALPHQAPAQVVARARAPVADQDRRHLGAGGLQRGPPAVDPLGGLEEVGTARDVDDGRVAEVEQVLRGERRAGDLIHGDDRQGVRRSRLDHDERGVARQRDQRLARPLQRSDDEDAVDALHAQALDRAQHRGAVERLEAHDGDEVAGVVRGPLDRVQRRGGPEQRRVEAHHAERARAPGDERARRGVRVVVELLHREQDALARLGAHLRAAVEHPRDGLMGDACELGHVGHHGRATAALSPAAGLAGRAHALSVSERSRFR